MFLSYFVMNFTALELNKNESTTYKNVQVTMEVLKIPETQAKVLSTKPDDLISVLGNYLI